MVDVDAAGAVAHGGLVGAAVERPAGRAGEHHGPCADCGTDTIGRFCHSCGNASHVHRTLLHLGEELLHGVMHFDSRAWRTIPRLIFRPGQLTREWCMGKRARYVSPLAVFLFTVFVIFMLLSYLPSPAATPAEMKVAVAAKVSRERTELANAEAALRAAATPEARNEAAAVVEDAREELDEALTQQKQMESIAEIPENWREELASELENGALKVSTGSKRLDKKLAEKAKNPELAIYKLQQTFYKFSFLLIPISIPFVALLFLWKRGFTLYDHGVFVLYSLSFMSMLLLVLALAGRIHGVLGGLAWAAAPFVVPAHMFFQLKGAYGLRTFSALWRTWFLLWFCLFALLLFVLTVIWLGMA